MFFGKGSAETPLPNFAGEEIALSGLSVLFDATEYFRSV